MKQSILRDTLKSVGIAVTIFCIIGVIFDRINGGSFTLENYSFTKMFLGSIGIGLGFGLPGFIYERESMPLVVRTLFHMGIGCVVMTAVAFAVGWISAEAGFAAVAFTILIEVAVAFVIWFFFYLHMKRLAREINQKLEKKE